jgi:hypothetical protein
VTLEATVGDLSSSIGSHGRDRTRCRSANMAAAPAMELPT